MSLRAALIYHDEFDHDVELASTISPEAMEIVKREALILAELKIAHNLGDEVRELKYRLEYDQLKQLLDFVLPDLPSRVRNRNRE